MPSRTKSRTSNIAAAVTRQVERAISEKMAPGKPRKKRSAGGGSRSNHPVNALMPSLSSEGASYAAGLAHPFSDMADGCKIPEPYAQATVTHKMHVAHTITSDAAGSFDFVVVPHLLFSAAQFVGTSAGLSTFTPVNKPAGVTYFRFLSPAQLDATYSSYRVVACGVRIKSNVGFSDTAGRVYVARIPASNEQPGTSFQVGATLAGAAAAGGVPFNGVGVAQNIQTLPKAQSFTIAELHAESGVELNMHPVGPSALNFLDGALSTDEAGLSIGADRWQPSYYSTRGMQMLVFYGDGLKASTQVLTVELIVHVEGVPKVANATTLTLLPSGLKAQVMSNPMEALRIHGAAAAAPFAVKLREKAMHELEARAKTAGKNLLGKFAKRGLGRIAGEVLGLGAL